MDFASGKVKRVQVHVETQAVDDKLIGDYSSDNQFRVQFQAELNTLWQQKDAQLEKLK